ncbi:hypothetical protein A2154_03090 [Candidatus Gottesmanbacteria bacterium RBG_16_43_7]|uniref:Probable 2-phosphosulfolactate phosphatase n=1 Tax=Candidatus Gottesmanbacteria bacterium RBG_16_43_7 TaxID=1798373 RepID=A0A1F5ZBA2_9BACT|nr:MAG: hypothetical protein A2154_03090 [Candidatus Gottesmanbacteria bacterium RBG_16_43_7]
MIPEKSQNQEKVFSAGNINICFPWDLPFKLTGPVVMFDILAASFNIIYLSGITSELWVVSNDTVHMALEKINDAVLVGESTDPRLHQKFSVTNNPVDIVNANLKSKKVILITNNGTQTLGELWTKGARPVIIGHYVNSNAVIKYLRNNYAESAGISLVPSGGREEVFHADPNLKEDLYCAQAYADLLAGNNPDYNSLFEKSRESFAIQYPPTSQPTPAQLSLIFQIAKYDTVPICRKESSGILQVVS